jgi:Tol biopolymer transport system component
MLVAGVAAFVVLALASPPVSYATAPGTNGKLAFASNEQLFTIDPDGSNLTQVPTTSCEGLEPDWAPDGHTLGFIERCGPTHTFDLSVVDVDGSGLRRVYATNRDDARIDWSPDGSRALFISDVSGNREIYLSDAAFVSVTNLTNNPGEDDFPAWSPDGTKIAFSSDRSGNFEVYTMDPNGTGVTNLTNNSGPDGGGDRASGGASWSPDGRRIAFDSYRTGRSEIYSMNADGSDLAQLTSGGNNLEPAWSPDGRLIAFASDRNGSRDLFLMAPDGTGQSALTTSFAFDERPDWQVLPSCKPKPPHRGKGHGKHCRGAGKSG